MSQKTATEIINSILPHSLLSAFGRNEAKELLSQAKVVPFKPGSNLENKVLFGKYISILLEGDVFLVDPQSRVSQNVKPGRTIELETVFQKKDVWRFHWQAKSSGSLLILPHDSFFWALKNNTVLFAYLERTCTGPTFHKLKRDLVLLGASKKSLHGLFSHAQIHSGPYLTELLKNPKRTTSYLCLIHTGSLKLSFEHDGLISPVEEYHPQDYFILDPTYILTSVSNAQCYFMDISPWLKAQGQSLVLKNTLNQKIDKILALSAPAPGIETKFYEASQSFDLNEEDDGLEVKDFQPGEAFISKQHRQTFPAFLQHDAMDCGAACLAMISAFYKKKVNIPTWRNLVHITREGASMLSLKRAAERVGFDSIGVMTGYKAMQKLQVPLIALMQYHFVVVYKITDTDVTFGDPAVGLRVLSKEDFLKEYSNNCLLLKPNEKLKHFPNSKNTFLKYLQLFQNSKLQIFEIAFISMMIFILGLSLPLFSQFIFDNVLKTMDKKFLTLSCVVFMLIGLFSGFTEKIRSNLIHRLTSKLDTQFTALFLNHVFRLPFAYFAVRDVGDILTRLDELKNIRRFFSTKLVVTLINLLSIAVYGSVLYLYNPKLFLVFIPILPPFGIILFQMMKKVRSNLHETFHASRKNQSMVFEQIKNIEVLQSLNALLSARWRYEETLEKVLSLKLKFEKMVMRMNTYSVFMQDVTQYTLYAFAGFLFIKNELSLGQVVAVSQLSSSLISPLIALIQDWDEFNKISISLEKVDEIFTSPTEKLDLKRSDKRLPLNGDISFKNIYFQYGSEHSPMILKNVSLDIPENSTVAFVGKSGCGKTTLAYMLNQLYTPIRGQVCIGDKDVSQIRLDTLRQEIALINQDNNVFAGSIEENILLGSQHKDSQRMIEAARSADAHDFIMEKEGGYGFILGENGEGLSDGQKQRLNIARALYRNPNILVMDEATSMLDAESEAKIIDHIKQSGQKRTTVIIAHRLNTIRHADKIFVLHNGRVVEEGSHTELLSKQKMYYHMFKKQLSDDSQII